MQNLSKCVRRKIIGLYTQFLNSRAALYSKINFDIVLFCLNNQDNNRYDIYIQFSIQYQYCGVKNIKNLALS